MKFTQYEFLFSLSKELCVHANICESHYTCMRNVNGRCMENFMSHVVFL